MSGEHLPSHSDPNPMILNGPSCSYCTTSQMSQTSQPSPTHPPWTPTKDLAKRKIYQKRMRSLIQTLETEQVNKIRSSRSLPDFRAGDILEVRVVVPENERKEYMYKGVCIARGSKGIRSWFKIYNVFPEVGGFVQHFPLYMRDLLDVKVVGRIKAKRAKLYHLLENQTDQMMFQTYVEPPKTSS